MQPAIDVLINAGGGSFVEQKTEQQVRDAFCENGIEINLHLAKDGDEIERFAEEADAGAAGTLVAGGGDGTINAVGSKVAAAGKILGVLPLGTLNHFSKDLGIPQDLAGAVAVIAGGHHKKVDLGEVNGHIFLNNSSIGLYPLIVHRREQEQQRLGRGKWSAAFIAALRVFRRDPFYRVRFELDGKAFSRKTPFVFVGNNEYNMDLYKIGRRENLTSGKLSVYFLKRGGRWGVIRLLVRTALGLLKRAKDFEAITVDQITIDVRARRIMVARDGEVMWMETPLNYRSLPGKLSVIVPVERGEGT